MKIKLLKPVIVRDNPSVKVGDVFSPSNEVASELICMGLAEPCEVVAKGEPEIQTREPIIEHRDPIAETQPQKSSRRRVAK